jgi:hypothetical protein
MQSYFVLVVVLQVFIGKWYEWDGCTEPLMRNVLNSPLVIVFWKKNENYFLNAVIMPIFNFFIQQNLKFFVLKISVSLLSYFFLFSGNVIREMFVISNSLFLLRFWEMLNENSSHLQPIYQTYFFFETLCVELVYRRLISP